MTEENAITPGVQVVMSGPQFAGLALEDLADVLSENWWVQFRTRTDPEGVHHSTVMRLLRDGAVSRVLVSSGES